MKSSRVVTIRDIKHDVTKSFLMAPPPVHSPSAAEMFSKLVTKETEHSEDLRPAQGSSMLQFIKALLFRRDLQDQIHLVACMTAREWEAGQRALISARWLAVSKNWYTVAVCQICLDEISRLKDQLVADTSVRLVQTARLVNSNAMYLSRNALVVQFNHGISCAKEFLTMEDDCAVVIPLLVPDNCSLTCWDRTQPANFTKVVFSLSRGYIMSGRTVLSIESDEPLLVLIFSMAAVKTGYPTYEVLTNYSTSHAG